MQRRPCSQRSLREGAVALALALAALLLLLGPGQLAPWSSAAGTAMGAHMESLRAGLFPAQPQNLSLAQALPLPALATRSASASASPEPLGDGDALFTFAPLEQHNPPLPHGVRLQAFTGTHGLHMSSHHCVGVYGVQPQPAGAEAANATAAAEPAAACGFQNLFCTDPFHGAYPNRTCSFRNLYYARLTAHPPPYSSHDWFYFHAVAPEEAAAPGWSAAALRARLEAGFRVDLLSRLKQDSLWRISVVFYLATPLLRAAAAAGGVGGALRAPLGLARPRPVRRAGGFLAGAPPAPVVADGATCTLLLPSGQHYHNASANASSPSSSPRAACLPPGVTAIAQRPFFLMYFSHHSNIGHTIWDDLVPFVAAAAVLGLPREEYDLLLTCLPQDSMFRWGHGDPPSAIMGTGDQGVRTAFYVTSPNQDPVQMNALAGEAGDRLVLFPAIAGGLTGMSPHNYRPTHLVYGAEPPLRSVWGLRQLMLAAMNFTAGEALRSARELPAPAPGKNVTLLFVRGKRGLSNLEELLQQIPLDFPSVHVSTVAWEEAGGIFNEARILSQAHILISLDGTVSLKNAFLPPGSVFIELGVSMPWGSQMLCDYLHGAYDHIRVLHYEALGPGEHEGNRLSAMRVPLPKLAPLLRRALALLQEGFPIPLPLGTNLDGNALLLRHLFARYPELPFYGVDLWNSAAIKALPVAQGVAGWYSSVVGRPPPDSLQRDIDAFCAEQPCGMP